MARLPDAQALGERPVPQPRGGIPSISNAGVAEGTQAQASTRGVAEFADQLSKAALKIQNREDAVEHVNRLGEYEEFSTSLLRDTSLKQDISDRGVLGGFGEELRKKKTEIVGRGGMSPDGMAKLEADLEKTRVSHSVKAGELSRIQSSKKTGILLNQTVNQLASEYIADVANPNKLNEVFSRLEDRIRVVSGNLEPYQEMQIRQDGQSLIVFSALSGLADKSPDAAEDVLRQTPGIAKILSPEHQAGILGKINTARSALNKPVVLSEGATLVNPRTGETLASGAPKKQPLKEIYDATSPSKTRLVPEDQAAYQPGPEKKPLVTNDESYESALAKKRADKDSAREDEIDKNARAAAFIKADTASVRASIQGGADPGFAGPQRAALGRFLKFTGMQTEETKRLTGEAASAEVLEAASKRLASGIAERLSRVTNMSLGFIEDSVPGLSKTIPGNLVIADIWDAIATRDKLIASLKDEYISKYGSLRPQGVEAFSQRINRLDDEDPIISKELQQKIIDLNTAAPKSWGDMVNKDAYDQASIPPNVKQRPGLDLLGVRDGKVWFKRKSDGKKFSEPLDVYKSGD